jgi:uncharacterized surface protein with fasciclin (FAS1) repeats
MHAMRHYAHHSRSSAVAVVVVLFAHCLFASAAIILPSARAPAIHSRPALNVSAYSPADHNLWHIIRDNDGLFSQLHAYIKLAPDIELQLQGASSSITFFAPENVAFGRLSPDELALFESDISTHLKYHILPHIIVEKDMRDGSQEATEQGSAVYITVQGSERDIWINDAYIVDGDHLAQNGGIVFILVTCLICLRR